jgi:hypothetical protein
VPAATLFVDRRPSGGRSHPDCRPRGLADRVGQGLEVVGVRLQRVGVGRQPYDLPAARRRQPFAVRLAEVVAVRFGIHRERTQHCGRLGVDVGERGHGCLAARGTRAAANGAHVGERYRRARPAPRIAEPGSGRVAAYPARVRLSLGPTGSDAPDPAGDPRPRRRDRHGRGIRGSLAPAGVPLSRTRPERFDDLVLDAVEQVERAVKDDAALAERLAAVEYGIEEVPPESAIDAAVAGAEPLPLARGEAAEAGNPPRVVLYRRPIELRAPDPRDREGVVHEVVVDRLAELLGVTIDQLDPPLPD